MQVGRSSGWVKIFDTTTLILGDCIAHSLLPEDVKDWMLSPSLLLGNAAVHVKLQKGNLQSKAAGGGCQALKFCSFLI